MNAVLTCLKTENQLQTNKCGLRTSTRFKRISVQLAHIDGIWLTVIHYINQTSGIL